ncbi:hypothetical protein [Nocardioides pinisoli]|uniref:Uncharacterized protein n=1 Tax=Nocardioides pinisoli TaxID=2950279 RepID=A0ABT1KSK8_9ACTN|nr:hypothetical protein [Nocardioides pinisoli]MCP3420344.1 hypothetical protein [Nocardioides pinisoli]
MTRIAITLTTLVAAAALSSCSNGAKSISVDLPDDDSSTQVTAITASAINDAIAAARGEAPRLWHLNPVEVTDGTSEASILVIADDFAVAACEAVKSAVRTAKLTEMPVLITAADTGVPVAVSNPDSRFETNCQTVT